jgi:hypothetical protein
MNSIAAGGLSFQFLILNFFTTRRWRLETCGIKKGCRHKLATAPQAA